MNKQLIKKFKKYLESKSAFYIYLKMYRDRRIGGAEGSGTSAPSNLFGKNISDIRHLRRYGCPERLKCLICLTSFLEKQTSGDSEREVYC